MSNAEDRNEGLPPAAPRRPYVPPAIESEPILEKQLLVICYTLEEGCQQDPPQS
jgi:hypothetical protein